MSPRLDALKRLQSIKRENRLFLFEPYPFQREFYRAGRDCPERILMAANRVGKTRSAAHEVAYHATGLYPDWWDGIRFDVAPLIWVGGVTNESLRDIVQKELLGGSGEDLGTGAIPKEHIAAVTKRQCGIGDVADQAKIRHVSGEISTVVFKSYEQGWKKWQGTAPHCVWLDEEPDDYKIYTECRTRIITSKGVIMVTFTPLSGVTELVMHFRDGKPGTYIKNATWDDAPHLGEKEKREALASYPEYERDARSKGLPMMGQGRVFPVDEASIKCPAFAIPDHFFRIAGIDFGWDHPNATVLLAWDRDTDILYVADGEKQSNRKVADHALKIKAIGGDVMRGRVPVAWPHDGENSKEGVQLKSLYLQHGVSLLTDSARYDDEIGGSQPQEPVIQEIFERMVSGRFKVFEHLNGWFEEFRNYHRIVKRQEARDTVKVVSRLDDMLKATFYAVMMKRFATPRYMAHRQDRASGSYLS